MSIVLKLYDGETFCTEEYSIEVSYQYGIRTNERTSKQLAEFIKSPFFMHWYASDNTFYTITSDNAIVHCTGGAIGTIRFIL